MKPPILNLLFFFFALQLQAQTITGTVKDQNEQPLENTNVMAKPLGGKKGMKFAIADHLGRYKLELEKETDYEITVNYIGFVGEKITYSNENPITTYHFVLQAQEIQLDEIVIEYDYQPVIVKKDTLIFDVAAFANGNERKLKEQLEKLPGVEVSENGQVKVQGKTVTQFMVEGKSFFGGGTKIGVENIPADAVDKVEVIDHFTEVAHMKEVSGSDDLAMNIKLKEDKKQFVFGDLRLGYGNNKYYETHASLFYYAPKINWSAILNVNNYGGQILDYSDIARFEGFKSLYLKEKKSLINLYDYTTPNTNVTENKNQFLATDFRYSFGKRWDVKAFVLANKNWIRSQSDQSIEYLQENEISFENRNTFGKAKTSLISGRISADFRQNKTTNYSYNFQTSLSNNNRNNSIQTQNNLRETLFETHSQADNFAIAQLFEYQKTFNKKHKGSFALSHNYSNEKPTYQWGADQSFLGEYIPLQAADFYLLQQIEKVQNNQIQTSFKHFWIAGKRHHIYTTLGLNANLTKLHSASNQLIENTSRSLFDAGFGNDLDYKLFNTYLGLEYKLLYKKLTTTFGLQLNNYNLHNKQITDNRTFNKWFLEPTVTAVYDFNKSESLNFNYNLSNDFLDANSYANRYQIYSFNSIYQGNTLLQSLRYHSLNLRYSKFNMYQGSSIWASINYNKQNNTIRNQVEVTNTDLFYQTVMTNNPDERVSMYGSFTQRVKKWEFGVNGNLSFNKYVQNTNNIDIPTQNNNQSIGLSVKTFYKEIPTFRIGYNKSFSQLKSSYNNKSTADNLSFGVDYKFLKGFVFKGDYNYNISKYNTSNIKYEQANVSLEYKKENSPWLFMIQGNNLFNTGLINKISFSNFQIVNSNTYILPRVFLFSVQYKL